MRAPLDNKTIASISNSIYESIIARSLQKLSPQEKNELQAILENNPTPDVLDGFIRRKIPELDLIAEEEINIARSRMIQGCDIVS